MVDVAVPTAAPLSALRRVELAHTGRWALGSGLWNASRDDFVAAVAALDCPAVRRPVLKLGHSQGEEPLWAGNPTGAPAVGYVDNLSLTNQGHTLVGDFVGMPGWLGDVAASAYPDRSIEGTHDFRCQIGHTHPFVVTAVALLGVTRPGVGTLKSLQDVGALYGVQADAGAQVEARFDPGQPRWPAGAPGGLGGQWRDALGLASRIRLGSGETLGGSSAIDADDSVVPVAAVRTPDGPRLRIGTGIAAEDRQRWSGANRGSTANLDAGGAQELASGLRQAADAGEQGETRRAELTDRADRLRARERELVRSQFNLSPEQAQELDRLDEELEDLDSRIPFAESKQQERLGRLRPEVRAEYDRLDADIAAVSAERDRVIGDFWAGGGRDRDLLNRYSDLDRQVLDLIDHQRATALGRPIEELQELDELNRQPVTRLTVEQRRRRNELQIPQSGLGDADVHWQFFDRDRDRLTSLRLDRRNAQQQRDQLTADANPSPAAAAEAARVAAERRQADDDVLAFTDGGELYRGEVPSAWGDLVYEVTMQEGGPTYRIAVRRPDAPAGWNPADDETESDLTPQQVRQLADTIEALLADAREEVPVAASAADHLEGWTLGDSEVDLDLWADGTVTLGWDQTEHHLADADGLVAALNEVRGGHAVAQDVALDEGTLRVLRGPGGDVHLATDAGSVLLSDDDAFDAQLAIVQWGSPDEVEARVFDPAKHPRWPKGTPGGLGGRFMPKDLVPRVSGGTESRSRRRTTPPARPRSRSAPRRVRPGVTQADQARTSQALQDLDERISRVPGTGQRRGEVPALTDTVRGIRNSVDRGDVTPDEAQVALSQLAFRQDVANDERLADPLHRALNELREAPAPEPPSVPEPRTPEPPTVPSAPEPPTVTPQPQRPSVPTPREELDRQVTDTLQDLLARQRAEGGSEWMSLADIRDALPGLSRQEVDDTLRRLAVEGDRPVVLVPENNQKTLTGRDRDAAITQGGQAKHYVALDEAALPQSRTPSAPAPQPATPAAPTQQPTSDAPAGGLLARLRSAGSREAAREMLAGLSVAQLKALARDANIAFPSGIRKSDLTDLIVQWTIGRRLDSDAISRPANLRAAALRQVAAAADVRTGAMVALLPSADDARRLAVDGGEAADQLHATLLFLGEATEYPTEARAAIVEAVRDLAEVIPAGQVDGMALSAFNPDKPDKDTAIVLELGGDGLEDVQGLTEQAVTDVAAEHGLALPEQHSPYRPHITLLYADDLMQVARLADRAGPVRLDRLRVAFAGENVDIPLTGEAADDPALDNVTDDDMPVAASEVVAQQSRRITRSDRPLRRYWLAGKGALRIRWNTPGDWTRCVRATRRYLRDPKGYCAVLHREATGVYPGSRFNVGRRNASAPLEEATVLPNPNSTVIHAAAQVSVDDVRTAYYRQAPQQAWIREFHTSPQRLIVANDSDGAVARVDFDITEDGEVRFSSPVPVRVEYVEQDDNADKVGASRMVYASAAESRPSIVTSPPPPPGFEPKQVQAASVSNRPWSDYTEADYSIEQWRRATLLDTGEGDEDSKSRYKLPVREPSGALNRNAIHAAAGGHGIGAVKGISDELRRSTARKIVRLYRDELGEEPPESLLSLAGSSTSASADPHKTPAAEPGNPSTEEEIMPLSTEVYQRLGLAEDAESDAVNAAVLALADKADNAPDPQQVAAAAAENATLQEKVAALAEQVQSLSKEIADANAAKVAEVKASVIDDAIAKGRITPADREKWEQRYDKPGGPEIVAEVLASIADGTAMPVSPQGKVGDPLDVSAASLDDEDERIFRKLTEPAAVGATGEDN